MRRVVVVTVLFLFAVASISFAEGWDKPDKSKEIDKITVKGTLLCIDCNLRKMSGSPPQCEPYTYHETGFKTGDGVMWHIRKNDKGYDIIKAHKLLEGKDVNATITGWLYPIAHVIEIDTIEVEGVSITEIQKAAWEEDQALVKKLMKRKAGEPLSAVNAP